MDWVSISKNRVVLMLKVRIDFLRMLLKDTDSHQTFFRNKIWIPYDFTFNWSIINKRKKQIMLLTWIHEKEKKHRKGPASRQQMCEQ